MTLQGLVIHRPQLGKPWLVSQSTFHREESPHGWQAAHGTGRAEAHPLKHSQPRTERGCQMASVKLNKRIKQKKGSTIVPYSASASCFCPFVHRVLGGVTIASGPRSRSASKELMSCSQAAGTWDLSQKPEGVKNVSKERCPSCPGSLGTGLAHFLLLGISPTFPCQGTSRCFSEPPRQTLSQRYLETDGTTSSEWFRRTRPLYSFRYGTSQEALTSQRSQWLGTVERIWSQDTAVHAE